MRFFFDVQEGETVYPDQDGVDCASVDDAVRLASVAATQMCTDVLARSPQPAFSLNVRDGSQQVARVTLSLEITRES